MLKSRPKVWAVFVLVCLVGYFMITVATPAAYKQIKKGYYEDKVIQLQQEKNPTIAPTETTPETQVTEPTNSNTEANQNVEQSDVMKNVIQVSSYIIMYLGVVFLVFGIFSFSISFAHDNEETRFRGVSNMVIGALMIGLRSLVTMFIGVI